MRMQYCLSKPQTCCGEWNDFSARRARVAVQPGWPREGWRGTLRMLRDRRAPHVARRRSRWMAAQRPQQPRPGAGGVLPLGETNHRLKNHNCGCVLSCTPHSCSAHGSMEWKPRTAKNPGSPQYDTREEYPPSHTAAAAARHEGIFSSILGGWSAAATLQSFVHHPAHPSLRGQMGDDSWPELSS